MKTFKVVYSTLVLVFALMLSCSKNDIQNIENLKEIKPSNSQTETITIYHATWTEWGRSSQNCESWGLCNFQDCWFCCWNYLLNRQVDCETGLPLEWSGSIALSNEETSGFLVIELHSTYSDQNDAILNSKPLYIDSDLESDLFIVHNGVYQFDVNIGSEGGYSIPVSLK